MASTKRNKIENCETSEAQTSKKRHASVMFSAEDSGIESELETSLRANSQEKLGSDVTSLRTSRARERSHVGEPPRKKSLNPVDYKRNYQNPPVLRKSGESPMLRRSGGAQVPVRSGDFSVAAGPGIIQRNSRPHNLTSVSNSGGEIPMLRKSNTESGGPQLSKKSSRTQMRQESTRIEVSTGTHSTGGKTSGTSVSSCKISGTSVSSRKIDSNSQHNIRVRQTKMGLLSDSQIGFQKGSEKLQQVLKDVYHEATINIESKEAGRLLLADQLTDCLLQSSHSLTVLSQINGQINNSFQILFDKTDAPY